MALIAHFTMFAGYNAWANARIYDAASAMDDAARRRTVGAFFGSLHGTLNHLLVADRIWMQRFTGSGEIPAALDAILFDDFVELRAAREREDARICTYVKGLAPGDMDGVLHYRTVTNPTDVAQPLAGALGHFFNHQTHHRGQAHAILTHLGGRSAAPPLDLLIFQREAAAGSF